MPKTNSLFYAFNRGEISKSALSRVDNEKLRLAAETQINWMPLPTGPMMLRPGLEYIGATKSNNACKLIPFIFSRFDTALLEITTGKMRVWINDDLATRPAVSSAITGGSFASSAGWTTATTDGATASFSNKLVMAAAARGSTSAVYQEVTLAVADRLVEHGLRVEVARGPVNLRIGSSAGASEYLSATLETGTHALAFSPDGASFFVYFETQASTEAHITSVAIDGAGVLEVDAPWTATDLSLIRHSQSGDIVFVSCNGKQQRQIERHSTRGWSIVLYKSNDGPFAATGSSARMVAGAHTGNTTLTSDIRYFDDLHVGCLFRLFTEGQTATVGLAGENVPTEAVRITGVGSTADRAFTVTISGTWVGTLTLQRSYDSESAGFVDVSTHAANATVTPGDTNDNVIVWYRMVFKTGNYTSGTANIAFSYTGGGGAGICRVTAVNSALEAEVEVLKPFSSLQSTADWLEGEWSDVSGWPGAVSFHDGRLWWAGSDRIWGSVSEAYHSFDLDVEGDSAPIARSIGFGPVDIINWLLPLTRLIVGREGSEVSIRSSSFDEPLTPTNFTLKDCSTQGSSRLPAVKVDTNGIFVQQSERRIYELSFNSQILDYQANDLTRMNEDIGLTGFVDLFIQRQPHTRLHAIRADGMVAILTLDAVDEVNAWWRLETDGDIERGAVLPEDLDDAVYYVVKRTINGSTVRYIEKMARVNQCQGGNINRQLDSFVVFSGTPLETAAGLDHLIGKTVGIWAGGRDLGTAVVSGSGTVSLPSEEVEFIIGIPYTAQYKSAKLAYAAQMGTALTQKKKIDRLGLILIDTHYQGVEYGQSFDTMDPLPLIEDGEETEADTIHAYYDHDMFAVPGEWDTDARLCLRATAPRPATVSAAVVAVQTNER